MHRTATASLSFLTAFLLSFALVGCDSSPTSVQDFDVQPNMQSPSSGLSLVIAEGSTSFDVSYQGLDAHPEAQGSGALTVSKSTESGTPREGSQQWNLTYEESPDGIIQESVYITGTRGDRQISDTLSVTVSRFVVTNSFAADFAAIADFEDEQRDSTALGGATMAITSSNVATNSNGNNALEITDTPTGSVRFDRRASAPNANRFSFLAYADESFDLTFTFTEETGAGETTHEVTVPIQGGGEWTQYGVAFSQIGENFNPVASRAGGNGPLVSVEASANSNVTYVIDELLLAEDDEARIEIMDFERTGLAYGPPFCPPTFQKTSNNLANTADGFTAQTIEGGGCFGYNYSLSLAVEGSDVVSFRANASAGDSLQVFLETPDGEGGFGDAVTVGLPNGEWGKVEVPISDLGDSPGALDDSGLSNVGFTAAGDNPDFAIDDIKIMSPSN